MMNNEQIELLKKSGYEVIPELNVIKDTEMENPPLYITYNKKSNKFEINCKSMSIGSSGKVIAGFQNYVTVKTFLVLHLNSLRKKR